MFVLKDQKINNKRGRGWPIFWKRKDHKFHIQQVRYSDEPIIKAFLKMFFIFDSQLWISDDTKIHIFRDMNKMTAAASANGKHD